MVNLSQKEAKSFTEVHFAFFTSCVVAVVFEGRLMGGKL